MSPSAVYKRFSHTGAALKVSGFEGARLGSPAFANGEQPVAQTEAVLRAVAFRE